MSNVDINAYRARVGLNYSRSTRLHKHLRLTLDQFVVIFIKTYYKCLGVHLYSLCRIISNIEITKLIYAFLNVRLNYYSKQEHKLDDFQNMNLSVLSLYVILLTI